MTHTPLRRAAFGLFAATALAAGMLASTPSMATAAFDNHMSELVQHLKADPTYKRIPLDSTSDRQWFYDQTQALYEKKISQEQYVSQGSQRFPGYEASFTECAAFIVSISK